MKVEDGDLHFNWNPGVDLICVLEDQQDGSYTGECVDPSGEAGVLTMVPPEEG